MGNRIIDLSQTIYDGMPVFPGDNKTALKLGQTIENNGYNSFYLSSGMHAGTHIDLPLHLINGKDTADKYSLDNFTGKGCILDKRNQKLITLDDEDKSKINENDVILLLTGHDKYYGKPEYYMSHPVVDIKFAEYLIKQKIKLLGIDTPSPDPSPYTVHKLLLLNGILIIENVTNLEKLLGLNTFEFQAFPLKIKAEASIVRAVASTL